MTSYVDVTQAYGGLYLAFLLPLWCKSAQCSTLTPFGMCLLAELGYVQGVCLTWMDCNLLNKQTAIQSQGSTPSWQALRLALIWMLPLFPHKHVAQSLFAPAWCVSTRNFQVFCHIGDNWDTKCQPVHICFEFIDYLVSFPAAYLWPTSDAATWLGRSRLIEHYWPVMLPSTPGHIRSSPPAEFPTEPSFMDHW